MQLAGAAFLIAVLPVVLGAAERRPAPAVGRRAMVVADQHLAAKVGRDVLRAGGNAVDAAVAIGWALAVTQPCCGNVGGGGFMLVRTRDGRETFLDFRERAPFAARPDMYLDANGEIVRGASLVGHRAVAVPGTVMGLEKARIGHGTMSREELLAPAIRLAEEGFVLETGDVEILRLPFVDFARDPNVAAVFLKRGKPFEPGDRLVQKNLAATLRAIARDGTEAFYRGPIAEKLAAASASGGGILRREDLAGYFAAEREPVRCAYRGYDVTSAPPPSSGGTTICEILNVVEAYPLGAHGYGSADAVHRMIEAERHAYSDRNANLGDPDFVENPLERLLSAERAEEIRARIDPAKAGQSKEVGTFGHEGESTTHYSVVDAEGNAVAVTYTINAYFGAQVMADDTGFFLNDEMDDFSAKPGAPNLYGLVEGTANAIAPGKRPLSSMSPTIVSRNGKTFLVLGSPGGSRIITITLGVLQNVIDWGMPIQEAVDAPRVHHQWLPDSVDLEPGALSAEVRRDLERRGHTLKESPRTWGAAECILVDPKTGLRHGANDRRRPAGAAIGF